MDELTRRTAFTIAGMALALTATGVEADEPPKKDAPAPKTDRGFVMAAGMTEAEADCWAVVADAAGKFFALPKLHPMDEHEVAHALHVIQHKLLSRPTYRKYLELAKANAKK